MRRTKSVIILVSIGLLIIAFVHYWREGQDGDGYESYAHRLDRYRSCTEQLVRDECTNKVTGLKQFIKIDISTDNDNVKQWKATAIVEYVNHLGGIDRTNMEFQFDVLGGDFCCYKKEPPWHLPEN